LFSVTDVDLKSASNGGQVAQANGNDILFTALDGVTKLNHELNSYQASSGTVTAWVQVPALSPTIDTTIYIYYGNASAANQQNPSGVWDSSFKGVWHFPDGSTLSANDSTSNANNGTITNAAAVSGQIGGGASFNGSSAFIDAGSSSSLKPTTSGTFSVWLKATTVGAYNTWMSNGNMGGAESNGINSYFLSGKVVASFNNGTSSHQIVQSGTSISSGTWYHYAVTWDGSRINIYLNGASNASAIQSVTPSPLYDLMFGDDGNHTGGAKFSGVLDEARVSNVARSADWIATEYNNQGSPSTFFTEGPQQ
jgi:hypothetical protein